MITRLVIVTDELNAQLRNGISVALGRAGVVWWHQFQQVWLVVDPQGRNAAWWRDWTMAVTPTVRHLVFEVGDGVGWAGALPNEHAVWIFQHWNPHSTR